MAKRVNEPSPGSQFVDVPDDDDENDVTPEPDANDSRTLDNVRGELLRKQERDNAQTQEQIGMLAESMQKLADSMANAQVAPRPAPAPQAPDPISQYTPNPRVGEYTDEQLQTALRSGQLTPAQEKEIDRVLSERGTTRTVTELLDQRDAQHKQTTAASEAHEAAVAAFPALLDARSEFSRRHKTALDAQRTAHGAFPTDEFDVANRIARQMGVEVSKVVNQGYIGRPDSHAPDKTIEEYTGPPEAELREISESLKYAMPLRRNPKTGRMERKQFNIKRVKERAKRYNQERDAGLRGQRKIRGGQ